MTIDQVVWQCKVKGNPMYVLVQKLKLLKNVLIQWNKDKVWNIVDRVKVAKEEMYQVHTKQQANPLCREIIQEERIEVHDFLSSQRRRSPFKDRNQWSIE